jgi:hypothetical protein
MIDFLVIYFAIGFELALIFFLISLFIEKMQDDMKLFTIYCWLMVFLWPFVLVKIIIDIVTIIIDKLI